MLNRRLWIVGLFAVACAWQSGNVTADELRDQLPLNYTRDLYQSRFGFYPTANNTEQNAANTPGYQPAFSERLMNILPGSDRPALSHDQPSLPPVDLRPAGNRTSGMNWDPLALDDLSAPQKVAVRRPTSTEADDNSINPCKVTPCSHTCPTCQGTIGEGPACKGSVPQEADIDAAAQYVPEEPAETRLREGEPAKLLLQTMKQVRPSIIDGTIFQDSRPIDDAEAAPLEGEGSAAIIVRCIRSLEAQADRQREVETKSCWSEVSGSTAATTQNSSPEAHPDAVSALRQAGRDLETTANMLEERGLYDQADHLRAVAQEMRIEARATVASDRPVSYMPTPMPGPDSDGDEFAGEKRHDLRQPKLHYDGDSEDQD